MSKLAAWREAAAKDIRVANEAQGNPDEVLKDALVFSRRSGRLSERDDSFAASLINGYGKYGSFTDRQRPYVEQLIQRAAVPVETQVATPVPTSAASPADPSKWVDLTDLPAGRYAIETRRYRVGRPVDGKWAGWIFVDDGSEYGVGEKYGNQKPGSKIFGCWARPANRTALVCADLRVILEDPRSASARFGQITGSCGICGRTLEDPESVARGIGPICNAKAGW